MYAGRQGRGRISGGRGERGANQNSSGGRGRSGAGGGGGGGGWGGGGKNNYNNNYYNNNHHSSGRRGGRGRGRGHASGGGRRGGGGGRGPPNFQIDWNQPVEELTPLPSRTSSSLVPQTDGSSDVNDVSMTDGIEQTKQTLSIAIQGCCHGELDAIYDRLIHHSKLTNTPLVDVLLCCGDFQSLRNTADYHSLAVPPKYRSIGSFWKYYQSGGTVRDPPPPAAADSVAESDTATTATTKYPIAPILTIFIGGNHEASQPLHELYYGGWVAPNIYYLGAAGVVSVAGIRIGGLSGIYKSHDYTQGRYEQPPYDRSALRSVYHVRNIDAYRLKCYSKRRIDIMLSHDWPQGIEQYGNTADLLRRKPYFREEVQRNDLGSPCHWELLTALQPKWWFSAHLHVKFQAQVIHPSTADNDTNTGETEAPKQPDKESSTVTSLVPSQVKQSTTPNSSGLPIQSDLIVQETTTTTTSLSNNTTATETEATPSTQFQSMESSKPPSCNNGMEDLTDQMTRFLSLDKCLPRRQHLSILHLPVSTDDRSLQYDAEWLAILKKTHHLTVAQHRRVSCPPQVMTPTEEELEWIHRQFQTTIGDDDIEMAMMIDPQKFCVTVPPYVPHEIVRPPLPRMGNPQTDDLLERLELNHIITIPYEPLSQPPQPQIQIRIPSDPPSQGKHRMLAISDENEIDIDDDDDDAHDDANDAVEEKVIVAGNVDENEINLDCDEDNSNARHDMTDDIDEKEKHLKGAVDKNEIEFDDNTNCGSGLLETIDQRGSYEGNMDHMENDEGNATKKPRVD